jgi:hypothetical protein
VVYAMSAVAPISDNRLESRAIALGLGIGGGVIVARCG